MSLALFKFKVHSAFYFFLKLCGTSEPHNCLSVLVRRNPGDHSKNFPHVLLSVGDGNIIKTAFFFHFLSTTNKLKIMCWFRRIKGQFKMPAPIVCCRRRCWQTTSDTVSCLIARKGGRALLCHQIRGILQLLIVFMFQPITALV